MKGSTYPDDVLNFTCGNLAREVMLPVHEICDLRVVHENDEPEQRQHLECGQRLGGDNTCRQKETGEPDQGHFVGECETPRLGKMVDGADQVWELFFTALLPLMFGISFILKSGGVSAAARDN